MTFENIDGTTNETGPYNTKIPALTDMADIQKALRIYHYGTETPPANQSEVIAKSVAGYLKDVNVKVTALQDQGIGSKLAAEKPVGAQITNGFIWVSDTAVAPVPGDLVAKYQTSEPTGTIQVGTLWVDSDSSPLKLYVYTGAAVGAGWKQIGA